MERPVRLFSIVLLLVLVLLATGEMGQNQMVAEARTCESQSHNCSIEHKNSSHHLSKANESTEVEYQAEFLSSENQ
ncbi:hypothetical protein Q3G72_007957 [Acer saccharum]|nr:hypothetical protein Q3G72_007957 [Acer saccharum]